MTKSETSAELRSHPAVRNYTLFCLTALFLLVVCLANRGLDWWCLVPALIGCLTLLTHWSQGPPLVLLSLVGLLGMYRPRWSYGGWPRFQTPTLMDLVLCIAVLGYVLGHYRLLSLMRSIFPPDPRRRGIDPSQRRSAELVKGWEMALLGLSLPVWTGLALMVWASGMADLATPPARSRPFGTYGPPLWSDLPLDIAHELRLIWAGLALLAAAGVAVSYLRWTTATPEEQFVYLQDQCWRQTRREQGLLNRWLTWARSRAQRTLCVPKQSLGARRQS
jgi:hypothetical protein